MKLKGLKFSIAQIEPDRYWPDVHQLASSDYEIRYSEKEHCVLFVKMNTDYVYHKEFRTRQAARYPDARPFTSEEGKRWEDQLRKREEKSKTAADRREFEKAMLGGTQTTQREALVLADYMNETHVTQTQTGLRIAGNYLENWGATFLFRIGKGEYLLGATLTGETSNAPSCAGRIATELLQYKGTFWPSNLLTARNKTEHDSHYVFGWCLGKLNWVICKSINARKKSAYQSVFQNVKTVYLAARARWGSECDESQLAQIEKLLSVYGDRKKSQEVKDAMFMQWKMEKHM